MSNTAKKSLKKQAPSKLGAMPKESAQVIKISSKRQITIPSKIFKAAGFRDYAVLTWEEDGIRIQPVDLPKEKISDDIISFLITRLVSEGYEGEQLSAKLGELAPLAQRLEEEIAVGVSDADNGRVVDYWEMQKEAEADYGLEA